jgi:acetyl-CoA carboxylase alpha subunit
MQLAEKFGLPIVTFIQHAGSLPGIVRRSEGRLSSIAKNLMEMADFASRSSAR